MLAIPEVALSFKTAREMLPLPKAVTLCSIVSSLVDSCICWLLFFASSTDPGIAVYSYYCGQLPEYCDFRPDHVLIGLVCLHAFVVLTAVPHLMPSQSVFEVRQHAEDLHTTMPAFLHGLAFMSVIMYSVQYLLSWMRKAGIAEDMEWGFSQILSVTQLSIIMVQVYHYLAEKTEHIADGNPRWRIWLEAAKGMWYVRLDSNLQRF